VAAPPRLRTLVVIGVGLIGGSFALALRRRGVVERVIGIGRTRANLEEARARGAIDEAHTLDGDWPRVIGDADVVMLATPVAQYPALLAQLAPRLAAQTIVTDAGSTKQDVVAAARATLGAALPRFVPGHPIAGSERTGAAAADADLFEAREVILTPLATTDADAQSRITALWEAVGARVTTLTPDAHDRLLACVSHLPHLVAFALMDQIARRGDAAAVIAHAGSGLRDATRIAASSPEMWRDIALANRAALQDELARLRIVLDEIASALASGDAGALTRIFERAAALRRAWAQTTSYPRAGAAGDDDA
jgi:prephenate dehydrogenase